MARAQLGELDAAKKLYEDADRWMRDHQNNDAELKRFREEAAALLYMKSIDAAKTPPKNAQPAPESSGKAGAPRK